MRISTLDPQQLSVLTEAPNRLFKERGILPDDDREHFGVLALRLYEQGLRTPDEMFEGLKESAATEVR